MAPKRVANHFTVVIPTLGRECLRDSVAAIANGTVVPGEIILSHQGQVGAMDSMVRDFAQLGVPIRYLHNDQRGAAAGRNAGLRQVKTPFFATTDDDCNVDPRWLEEIDRALQQNSKHIVTGCVLASEPGAPSVIITSEERIFTRVPLDGGHFSGGNFGTALANYQDVGGFDESELLRYCEDPEWAYRALAKGYPIRFIPAVAVTHLHWRDDQNMAKVFSQYAHSQGGWFGRRLRKGDLTFTVRLGYELARGAKRWCVGSLTGDRLRKMNGRAFVVDLLRGLAAGWNGR
jgi:GT2 family glycosyltransferase